MTGTLSAATIVYNVSLTGPNESPANASPGIGSAIITVDDLLHTMRLQVQFSGLVAPDTAAHIHCCTSVAGTGTAGVATTVPAFTGFPLGVTSGTYDQTLNTLDSGSYNPSFITANGGTVGSAETVLLSGIAAGKTYLNIHTSTFPSGEIRGFLPAADGQVPEPSTFILSGIALAALTFRRRRN